MIENLSEFERDQLTELINIGAGNATSALGNLIKKKIMFGIPKLQIDKIENLTQTVERELTKTTIYSKILGDSEGSMLFMLPVETSKYLSNTDCGIIIAIMVVFLRRL